MATLLVDPQGVLEVWLWMHEVLRRVLADCGLGLRLCFLLGASLTLLRLRPR